MGVKTIYWKRILFKTDMKAKYTRMNWRKCSSESDCPYDLKSDFELIAKLKHTHQPVMIKVELDTTEQTIKESKNE